MASSPIHVPKHLRSRLLYNNPVCLLTTKTQVTSNIMTITWITCLNNHGLFLCSIQSHRFTAKQLEKNPVFVLNIPVKGMEELILYIGSFHGNEETSKVRQIAEQFPSKFHLCEPGWKPMQMKTKELAIRECVAHLVCKVESKQETAGHQIMTCQITDAWVQSDYWQLGKCFIGLPTSPSLLTFLGSQKFGEMKACDNVFEKKEDNEPPQKKQKISREE